MCPDARAQLFTACLCYNSQENTIKDIIIASARWTSLHSLKTLMFRPSPSHRVCNSELDFCPMLNGVLRTVVSEFGHEAIGVTMWESPASNPNNISWTVEMCPYARAQLFTACPYYNSKENTIKNIMGNLSPLPGVFLFSFFRSQVITCGMAQSKTVLRRFEKPQ